MPSLPILPIAYRLLHSNPRIKILVLYNPFSGTRKSPAIVATIVRPLLQALGAWGLTFEVVETQAARHAVTIAKDVAASAAAAADVIVCVSGDGIIHEVVNGLYEGGGAA